MTENPEQRLGAGFREYAASVRLDADLVGAAAARHRRRGAVRRAVYATGALGVAATLSAALVANTGQPATSAQQGPGAGAAAPAIQLAAAVQATARTSFRLHITLTRSLEHADGGDGYSDSEEYAGAFDTAANRGYLNILPGRVRGQVVGRPGRLPQLRIIGNDVYMTIPGTNRAARHFRRSQLSGLLGTATPATSSALERLSVDPRVLLAELRHLGSVTRTGRSGSGDAAVDTYAFAYQVKAGDVTGAHRVTGRVAISVRSHKLAKITQQTTTVGADPTFADSTPLTWRQVIVFYDYGTPVHVAKPAGPAS